jgi:Rv2632c-like
MKQTAEIELAFDEDGDQTRAHISVVVRGVTFTASGRARRSPTDSNVPLVGEELAAARALSELAHRLIEAATEAISDKEGRPVHLNP